MLERVDFRGVLPGAGESGTEYVTDGADFESILMLVVSTITAEQQANASQVRAGSETEPQDSPINTQPALMASPPNTSTQEVLDQTKTNALPTHFRDLPSAELPRGKDDPENYESMDGKGPTERLSPLLRASEAISKPEVHRSEAPEIQPDEPARVVRPADLTPPKRESLPIGEKSPEKPAVNLPPVQAKKVLELETPKPEVHRGDVPEIQPDEPSRAVRPADLTPPKRELLTPREKGPEKPAVNLPPVQAKKVLELETPKPEVHLGEVPETQPDEPSRAVRPADLTPPKIESPPPGEKGPEKPVHAFRASHTESPKSINISPEDESVNSKELRNYYGSPEILKDLPKEEKVEAQVYVRSVQEETSKDTVPRKETPKQGESPDEDPGELPDTYPREPAPKNSGGPQKEVLSRSVPPVKDGVPLNQGSADGEPKDRIDTNQGRGEFLQGTREPFLRDENLRPEENSVRREIPFQTHRQEVKQVNLRMEDTHFRFRLYNEALSVEVRAAEALEKNLSYLDVQRLSRSIQALGLSLEGMRINGADLLPKNSRAGKREEKGVNIRKDAEISKEASNSTADSLDLNLLL